MRAFQRKYFCQDELRDSLTVSPIGCDGEDRLLRLVANSDEEDQVSVHLNRVQVANLIELSRDWLNDLPSEEDRLPLWKDI